MRRRLPGGVHVPHPAIRQLTGRVVRASFGTPRPLEIDGRPRPATPAITVEVAPEAVLLLV
jgi:diacylglycerol kinase family enzyme